MGLIQEFQRADADRRKDVAVLAREVAASLGDFRKFVRHLHKLSGDRRSDVAAMRADADAFVGHLHKVSTDRRSEVGGMRADTDAFVGHLHKVSTDRRSEVGGMRADTDAFVGHLHKVSAGRHREVGAMRAAADAFVGHLHTKVAADRRADVAAIHSEVWGGAARARRAAPPHRAAARPPAPADGKAAVTLRDVIFTYLAEHPDGTKLTQLEQDLSMARIKLAQVMRQLMEENKVEKRELRYFAI